MEKKINITISEELLKESELLFKELGLTTETAINIFLSACLREGGIPFPILLNNDDYYEYEDCDCECDCKCENNCNCEGK